MTYGGRNTYSAPLPTTAADVTFGHVQEQLGREHAATVIAIRRGGSLVNPTWDTPLGAGSILYTSASDA